MFRSIRIETRKIIFSFITLFQNCKFQSTFVKPTWSLDRLTMTITTIYTMFLLKKLKVKVFIELNNWHININLVWACNLAWFTGVSYCCLNTGSTILGVKNSFFEFNNTPSASHSVILNPSSICLFRHLGNTPLTLKIKSPIQPLSPTCPEWLSLQCSQCNNC